MQRVLIIVQADIGSKCMNIITNYITHSCTSCIGASRCEWCPFSFQCIQPGTTSTIQEVYLHMWIFHMSILISSCICVFVYYLASLTATI